MAGICCKVENHEIDWNMAGNLLQDRYKYPSRSLVLSKYFFGGLEEKHRLYSLFGQGQCSSGILNCMKSRNLKNY